MPSQHMGTTNTAGTPCTTGIATASTTTATSASSTSSTTSPTNTISTTSTTGTTITTNLTATTYTFTIQESKAATLALDSAKTISVTTSAAAGDADVLAGQINAAGFTNVVAVVDSTNKVSF